LAMRNSRLYPIWPAAPVTVIRIGAFMTISNAVIKRDILPVFAALAKNKVK
jgi:hypothetical protein